MATQSYAVVLKKAGTNEIETIKLAKEVTGLDLKTVKALIETLPSPIKSGLTIDEATALTSHFQQIGAIAEVGPTTDSEEKETQKRDQQQQASKEDIERLAVDLTNVLQNPACPEELLNAIGDVLSQIQSQSNILNADFLTGLFQSPRRGLPSETIEKTIPPPSLQ